MSGDGELRIVLNPAGADARGGCAFLSECFATRWTERLYRWYLERSFGGEPPDRLLLMAGSHAVAGCGLVYRQLRSPDGELHRVSVVVAAATLPEARGRGCYARVLQAAVERSAARACSALLGFVTADNATGRGLLRLGAAAIPSAYLLTRGRARVPQSGTLQLRDARVSDEWPARAQLRRRAPGASAGFHYPTAAAWRAQMIERPHGVRSLRVGATSRALIESVGDTDRLQWLDGEPRERAAAIRTLASQASRRARRFFMYSTCPAETATARRAGLAMRPGYLMVLPLAPAGAAAVTAWGNMPWHVQSGDRM